MELERMPDLITSLNTISNQISQIVDRVAGIELRVSAIEEPLRNTGAGKQHSSMPKEDEKRKVEVTSRLFSYVCKIFQGYR